MSQKKPPKPAPTPTPKTLGEGKSISSGRKIMEDVRNTHRPPRQPKPPPKDEV